jgi:hypothetical protein
VWSIAAAIVVMFAIAVATGLYAVAAPYGMADAAWSRGTTSLADGWAAFRRRWGALSAAGLRLVGRSLGRSAVLLLVQIALSYALGYVTSIAITPLAFSVIRLGTEPALQAPPSVLVVAGAVVGLVYVLGSMALGGFYTIALAGFYRWLVDEAAASAVAAER